MFHFNSPGSIHSCCHFGALNLSYILASLSYQVRIYSCSQYIYIDNRQYCAISHRILGHKQRNNVPTLRGEKHENLSLTGFEPGSDNCKSPHSNHCVTSISTHISMSSLLWPGLWHMIMPRICAPLSSVR